MFVEWIERQRTKSLHERRMIALAIAFTITGVVAGFYIAGFSFSDEAPQEAGANFERTNPFSSLVETISESIDSFGEQK